MILDIIAVQLCSIARRFRTWVGNLTRLAAWSVQTLCSKPGRKTGEGTYRVVHGHLGRLDLNRALRKVPAADQEQERQRKRTGPLDHSSLGKLE